MPVWYVIALTVPAINGPQIHHIVKVLKANTNNLSGCDEELSRMRYEHQGPGWYNQFIFDREVEDIRTMFTVGEER